MTRRIARSAFILALLAALVAILAAACATDDAPQRLTLNIKVDPASLDPAHAVGTEAVSVQRQLFRGLVRFDAALSIIPDVARDVPSHENGGLSDDGRIYTFAIRDGARWSDGRPVTANDFVFALRRVLDPGEASEQAAAFHAIAGAAAYNTALVDDHGEPRSRSQAQLDALRDAVAITALDAARLQITLTQANPAFLQVLTLTAAFPVRADVIDAHGPAWTRPGALVGNGPFTLSAWERDVRIVLSAVDDWWGGDVGGDRLEFRMTPDDNAAYAAYLAGELDVVEVPAALVPDVLANEALAGQLTRTTDLTTVTFVFNTRRAPFNDPDVRRAFAAALDRTTFVNAINGGIGQAARGWLPPGLPGAELPTNPVTFDPDLARTLLAATGYDGPAFPSVELAFVNVGASPLQAEFAQEQFRRHLGVDVALTGLDPSAYGPKLFSGDFDIGLFFRTADFPHPENWLPDLFTSDGPFNFGGWSNAAFDAAVAAARTANDPGARLSAWRDAHAILMADGPLAVLLHRERVRLVSPTVKNLILTPIDGQAAGDNFLFQTTRTDKLVAAR